MMGLPKRREFRFDRGWGKKAARSLDFSI
jgi:hypothetical protein